MKKQIIHANIVLPDRVLEDGALCLENGVITDIVPGSLDGVEVLLDAEGAWLLPGFIDIHCHGGNGYDFTDATPEEMRKIAAFHLSHGTTTLIATTPTDRWEALHKALDRYAALLQSGDTLTLNGVYLEGPWLNPAQCGAQDTSKMDLPSVEKLQWLLEKYPFINRVAVAPELPNGHAVGEAGDAAGVVMTMAHTDANFDQIVEAVDHGYRVITHLYSGMRGTVRENAYRIAGGIEGCLYDDRIIAEVIADGKHLPIPLLKLIYKCKGADRICLITDGMRAAGLPNGTKSILGCIDDGVPCIVEDDVAKLPDRSAFAGSVATTDRLFRTMHRDAGIDIVAVSRMSSGTPAAVMGYTDRGAIEVGKRADLVLMDRDLQIKQVLLGGNVK